jgi:hypothetical protein
MIQTQSHRKHDRRDCICLQPNQASQAYLPVQQNGFTRSGKTRRKTTLHGKRYALNHTNMPPSMGIPPSTPTALTCQYMTIAHSTEPEKRGGQSNDEKKGATQSPLPCQVDQ